MARWLGKMPAQFDLIRSIRYIFPIMLLLAFWGASRITQTRWLSTGISALIFAYWFVAKDAPPSWPQNTNALAGIECWSKGQAVCPRRSSSDAAELLDVVRKQPGGMLFFSSTHGLALRSLARVPLAFSVSDLMWLVYSNQAKVVENADNLRTYIQIKMMKAGTEKALAWIDFAKSVHADYLVLKEEISEADMPSFAEIVFENRAGTLIGIYNEES